MDRARVGTARRPSRTTVVAGAVVAAYVAFAVFAQFVGEDEDRSVQGAAQMDVFCSALYSDYPNLLSTVASQGAAFGGGDATRVFFPSFTNAVQFAPEEFQERTTHLVEGLERAANGELSPEDVDGYVEAFNQLRDDATPLCNQVGQELLTDDPPD